MSCLLGSVKAETDRYEFMKIQVLFWLLAATDGHAKNFSLFIEAEGHYRLTPFYLQQVPYKYGTYSHYGYIYPMDFEMHRDGKGANPREHR